VRSPSSHSPKKYMLRPDVDLSWWFLYICGSCANSHEMMLHVPSNVENSARFVGTQTPKEAERVWRNAFAGSQCAGNVGSTIRRGDK
jgi:hypothetical protein